MAATAAIANLLGLAVPASPPRAVPQRQRHCRPRLPVAALAAIETSPEDSPTPEPAGTERQKLRRRRMRVRREARFLLQLLGKHGETLRTLREAIAVPRVIENELRKYAQTFPADTWVLDALQFRKEVAEEVDSLVKEPKYAELVAGG